MTQRFTFFGRSVRAVSCHDEMIHVLREGEVYLSNYPLFLSWAHYLYTLVFPILLSVVAVVWTYRQIPGPLPWPASVWFDGVVTVALLASIAMYLHAFHRRDRGRLEADKSTKSSAD